MKGRWISYSAEELAWLEENRTMAIGDYARAFVERFARDDVTAANLHALRKRKGWKTGRTGRFGKGHRPVNKGRKCGPNEGGNHPNARRTQFRSGCRVGRANKLWKPIGTERMNADGYLERKVHDGMPLRSRWQAVHRIRWEEVNGPLPEGHALKCLDGDRSNTDPRNWIAVPRAMLPRLNGRFGRDYDAAPAELKPTIMAVAKLENAALERRRSRSGRSGPPRPSMECREAAE